MEEDAKVACSDSRVDSEVGIRVGRVAEGKRRNWVAKTAAATFVMECDKLRLIRVNAQTATGHPINNNVKMGGDEVCRAYMVAGNSKQSTIVDVELCVAIQPMFCQMKEWSGIDGGKNGR
jgi:hypothetical protein